MPEFDEKFGPQLPSRPAEGWDVAQCGDYFHIRGEQICADLAPEHFMKFDRACRDLLHNLGPLSASDQNIKSLEMMALGRLASQFSITYDGSEWQTCLALREMIKLTVSVWPARASAEAIFDVREGDLKKNDGMEAAVERLLTGDNNSKYIEIFDPRQLNIKPAIDEAHACSRLRLLSVGMIQQENGLRDEQLDPVKFIRDVFSEGKKTVLTASADEINLFHAITMMKSSEAGITSKAAYDSLMSYRVTERFLNELKARFSNINLSVDELDKISYYINIMVNWRLRLINIEQSTPKNVRFLCYVQGVAYDPRLNVHEQLQRKKDEIAKSRADIEGGPKGFHVGSIFDFVDIVVTDGKILLFELLKDYKGLGTGHDILSLCERNICESGPLDQVKFIYSDKLQAYISFDDFAKSEFTAGRCEEHFKDGIGGYVVSYNAQLEGHLSDQPKTWKGDQSTPLVYEPDYQDLYIRAQNELTLRYFDTERAIAVAFVRRHIGRKGQLNSDKFNEIVASAKAVKSACLQFMETIKALGPPLSYLYDGQKSEADEMEYVLRVLKLNKSYLFNYFK
jgi:hypothetical protein